MAAAHLCCRRMCRTIHLLNIKLAQDVLGWQSSRQRTIRPLLNTPMALQPRQNFDITVYSTLLCDRALEQHENCNVDCTCPVEQHLTALGWASPKACLRGQTSVKRLSWGSLAVLRSCLDAFRRR